MNNQNNIFYPNLVLLITGMVILVSFLAFPYLDAGVGLGLSVSALDLLSVTSLVGYTVTLVLLVPVVGLIAVISGSIALGNPQTSKSIAYINFGAGMVLLLYLLYDLFQLAGVLGMGFAGAMGAMGFGYWMISLASLVLIFQIFVPRETGKGAYGQVNMPIGGQYMAQPTQMPAQPPPVQQQPEIPMATSLPTNAWLVNVQTGQSHQLVQGESRVGRSKSRNNVIISDPSVSRDHALIRNVNNQYILHEVGSQQPVFVNGQPIRSQHVLQQNDQIKLGNVQLRFVRG